MTSLLDQVRRDEPGAVDRLMELICAELRKLAHSKMRTERKGHILQITALVNEAILALLKGDTLKRAPSLRYVMGAASRAMRNVLVDHGRKRKNERRLVVDDPSALDEIIVEMEDDGLPILELHAALEELELIHPRQASVVEMRFFGGYSVKATAEALDVSISTVEDDFRIARAWLRVKLREHM